MLGWREQRRRAGRAAAQARRVARTAVDGARRARHAGLTAWVGLIDIGQVQEGETIYVSGAAGAVGSTAVQIAKLKGLRVIGSAGSAEKVEWLRSLGVEAFNYRETPAKEALADGIDVYFDNVGGEQLEAALGALRPFGRVVACGAISRYNDERPEPGPRNLGFIVTKRLRVQGFIVSDHSDRFRDFAAEVGPWVARRADRIPRDDPRGDRERAGRVRRALPRRQHRQDARARRVRRRSRVLDRRVEEREPARQVLLDRQLLLELRLQLSSVALSRLSLSTGTNGQYAPRLKP